MSPRVCLATHYAVADCTWIENIPPVALSNFNLNGSRVELDGRPIEKFSRPVLRARVHLPQLGAGVQATVFGTHLKSKSPDIVTNSGAGPLSDPIGQVRSLLRRGVEAVGLRALALNDLSAKEAAASAPSPPVIVCGDCNDDTIAVTTQVLCGRRSGGYATLLRSAVDLHSSRSLYSAYYSYIHDGYYESLDHILLSDHFAPGNVNRLGDVEYVRLFTDHLVDQTLYKESIPQFKSDHGQVVVTIKPRPAPPRNL